MLVENFSELINAKYKDDESFDKFLIEEDDFEIEFEREDDTLYYKKNVEKDFVKVLELLESIVRNEILSEEEMELLIEDKHDEEKNEEDIKRLLTYLLLEINRLALYFCREGISFLELVQEGVIGASKGARRYDSRNGRVKKYLKNWIAREISMYIYKRFYHLKGEFKYSISENRFKEIILSEEERLKKLEKLEKLRLVDIPFLLSNTEIKIMEMYFGLCEDKRVSMYEIEKKLDLGKNKGEEKFYSALKKLSKDIGGMFLI